MVVITIVRWGYKPIKNLVDLELEEVMHCSSRIGTCRLFF